MRPRVKICGITGIGDALNCAEAGADYLGFIFYDKSPRWIAPDKAKLIIRELPGNVTPVGVFVNASRATVDAVASTTGIQVIQLSGDEGPADCANYERPVWKSFRIREADKVSSVAGFQLDAAVLDGALDGEYGGSGRIADMSIARRMKSYHRLILAGGLTPENIRGAISSVEPFAVDVNSGVEMIAGKKDYARVKELFRQLSFIS